MSESYSKLAKYYDSLSGMPKQKSNWIKKWIQKYNPNGKSVLEIACGTGSILKPLENKYEVHGLDLSKDMLRIAKNKVKTGKFYHEDMVSFSLKNKFDVILCIYDSINHLTRFEDWKKTFQNASRHLNEEGIFIFDVNAPAKFNRLGINPDYDVIHIGEDIVIDSICKLGKNKAKFFTQIFENQRKNIFKKFEDVVVEVAFEKEKILNSLKKYFNIFEIYDPKRNKPSKNSERLYFVCGLK